MFFCSLLFLFFLCFRYQDKLAELLRLFATQHWREWTQDDDLPNILSALYEFTFSGYGALTFTERLAIWCPMVSGLSTSGGVRYIEIVQLLVSGILRKMQFRFDQESELDILDNERLDDDVSERFFFKLLFHFNQEDENRQNKILLFFFI